MKKILIVLLIGTMILSSSGCDDGSSEDNYSNSSNNTATEQSDIEEELTDIEMALGKIANDYLNTNITNDDAEEKLDVLYSRLKNIEDEATAIDDSVYDPDGSPERQRWLNLSSEIVNFNYDIFQNETNSISEIKEKYYKQ